MQFQFYTLIDRTQQGTGRVLCLDQRPAHPGKLIGWHDRQRLKMNALFFIHQSKHTCEEMGRACPPVVVSINASAAIKAHGTWWQQCWSSSELCGSLDLLAWLLWLRRGRLNRTPTVVVFSRNLRR